MAESTAERSGEKRVLLLSDFSIEPLRRFLETHGTALPLKAVCAPYGQVRQPLLHTDTDLWQPKPDACVVWTQLESISPAFRGLLEGESVSHEHLLADVREFAEQIAAAADATRLMLVPLWTLPPWRRGTGLGDLQRSGGCRRALLEANLLLCEVLEEASNAFAMDTQRWTQLAGHRAYDSRMRFIAKVPFGNDVFRAAAEDIRAALAGVSGMAKKLVVVDLDDTLWGGVVGDTGWRNLTLGGHDALGEAYAAFQRALKALTRRGVLLAILSKNQEDIALEAIDRHPEMLLRKNDFAGWRINWNDKAENLVDLVDELNLGMDAVVFVDDNPVERARIRDALPEVLTVELPKSPMAYAETIQALPCFDLPSLTQEDRARTTSYAATRARTELRRQVPDRERWLSSLDTRCTVATLSKADLPRAAQLLNKTNQMNLTTRRMPEQALWDWSEDAGHAVFTFRVQDRFGDAGLTGLLALANVGETAVVTDFVLSCRVMGRRIEEAMLATAVQVAQGWATPRLCLNYEATERNGPCLEMLANSRLAPGEDTRFTWETGKPFPCPECVAVQWREEEA